MRMEMVRELLDLIVSFDRTPFPDHAAVAWFEALQVPDGAPPIEYRDAHQAVLEHYGTLGARDSRGDVRRALPADIKQRANAIREARERKLGALRPKLPAGRVGSTGRPAHVEALLREARARATAAQTDQADAVRRSMRPRERALAA